MADRRYEFGGLVVLWQSELCSHCGRCVAGLPDVFDADRVPWVDLSKGKPEQIRDQVRECPTGAISIPIDHVQGSQDRV